MRVAAAQIRPVLLDRAATLQQVVQAAQQAAQQDVGLCVFPEAVMPGYPVWLSRTDGARFDDDLQKQIHAVYLDQGVELPGAELQTLLDVAADLNMALVVGVMERGTSMGGRGSLWATALFVQPDRSWTAHRKLVPTYEERLAWAWGDGHGLRVHEVQGWRVSALNCWENWMPAARMAMYAQGTEVHCSLWPGSPQNTGDICRFTAREGRCYVVASCAVLRASDVPAGFPGREVMVADAGADGYLHTGGSRIVAPDVAEVASLLEPEEGIITADLDRSVLLRERQNFDAAGHYHRNDVFTFEIDQRRQRPATFRDE